MKQEMMGGSGINWTISNHLLQMKS